MDHLERLSLGMSANRIATFIAILALVISLSARRIAKALDEANELKKQEIELFEKYLEKSS
ncbi:MAG TPA: hypothetical protein PK122_02300 [Candidatus Paceibacterota bacterium]|nr:hypothetical protein [Candidatus Paceibacterota bacterium]HPI82039.1 hypothetical protein [Candidatus Paceibacterota bacterium]